MATSTSTRMVTVLLFLVVVVVVGAQAQTGPTPFASPPFNPTGATTFISYAALSANRAPCPSGTGRSYYSPGCEAKNLSATPYQRGCVQITRCARG